MAELFDDHQAHVFFDALLALDTRADCRDFFLDLCTIKELEAMEAAAAPKSEPAKVIEAVRLVAERRQNGSHMTAAAIPGKIEADADLPQQAIVSALRKYSK